MERIKKYIPNVITIIRLLFIPVFLIYLHDIVVYDCKSILSLLIFAIIIGSDLLDGALARFLKATSKTGAKLDVVADSLYLITSIGLLVGMSVLPLWFLILLIFKLMEFIITSKILHIRKSSSVFMDILGKAGASIAMAIPGILCIRFLLFDYKLFIHVGMSVVVVLFLISFVRRMIFIQRNF